MPIISLIAAVDEQFGLGKDNQLLCHLPADLKHFKTITMGKPIFMGRKTYESIGKPLPGRLNIVLSHQRQNIPGVEQVSSIQEALELVAESEELMIIGGQSLFSQTLSLAENIYLTKIHSNFKADVFFPKFNEKEWHCVSKEERPADEKNPYDLTFYHFKKIL